MHGMIPRGHARNPFLVPRHALAGGPILPAGPGRAHPSFALASGATPALVPDMATTGVDVPFGLPPLSFPANAAGTSLMTSDQSQGWYRPRRLVIGSAAITAGVTLTDIKIGVRSCLANGGNVIADGFALNAVDCGVTFFTAGPGITIKIIAVNPSAGAVVMTSTFYGAFVDGASGGTALVG